MRSPCPSVVPGEADEPAARERDEHVLPGVVRLGAFFVAEREENRGVLAGDCFRQIQVAGDEEAGLALENDFLDPVVGLEIEPTIRALSEVRCGSPPSMRQNFSRNSRRRDSRLCREEIREICSWRSSSILKARASDNAGALS
jgi:hypothetical protein